MSGKWRCVYYTHTHTHTHTVCVCVCVCVCVPLRHGESRASVAIELESASGLGPESEAAVWTKLKEGRGLASTARESETGPPGFSQLFSLRTVFVTQVGTSTTVGLSVGS